MPTSPTPVPQSAGRKKGTACARCRSHKIRCDDKRPSCSNCARLHRPCIRPSQVDNVETARHYEKLESRLRTLEGCLRRVAPQELERLDNDVRPHGLIDMRSSHAASGSPSNDHNLSTTSGQQVRQDTPFKQPVSLHSASLSPHDPDETLAHEGAMLSLANPAEPKYSGPSSGVPFARLIFSVISRSNGDFSNSWNASNVKDPRHDGSKIAPFEPSWSPDADINQFIDAYFEGYHPMHPFMDESAVASLLQRLSTDNSDSTMYQSPKPSLSMLATECSHFEFVQLLLMTALGARLLELRLSTGFSSERYLATAMQYTSSASYHDNLEGLRVSLLLCLCGFYFEHGPNPWYVTADLLASCLDLGLQRRTGILNENTSAEQRIYSQSRRAIFWCVYSLERTLAVILGRPLTLRDETIDAEFPGEEGDGHPRINPGQGIREPYIAARYSFSFDKIAAETKLMLYRVGQFPSYLSFPSDLSSWRSDVHERCDGLLAGLRADLRRHSIRSTYDNSMQNLELKYHQCIMLLHRPSRAFTQPSSASWKTCHRSAVATITINAELHRFSKLPNSWLTVQTVFVSGITFLYCLWVSPAIKQETSLDSYTTIASSCSMLLEHLSKTWTVAANVEGKFTRLAQLTENMWRAGQETQASMDGTESSLMSLFQAQYSGDVEQYDGGMAAQGLAVDMDIIDPAIFRSETEDMSLWLDLDWLLESSRAQDDSL